MCILFDYYDSAFYNSPFYSGSISTVDLILSACFVEGEQPDNYRGYLFTDSVLFEDYLFHN